MGLGGVMEDKFFGLAAVGGVAGGKVEGDMEDGLGQTILPGGGEGFELGELLVGLREEPLLPYFIVAQTGADEQEGCGLCLLVAVGDLGGLIAPDVAEGLSEFISRLLPEKTSSGKCKGHDK